MLYVHTLARTYHPYTCTHAHTHTRTHAHTHTFMHTHTQNAYSIKYLHTEVHWGRHSCLRPSRGCDSISPCSRPADAAEQFQLQQRHLADVTWTSGDLSAAARICRCRGLGTTVRKVAGAVRMVHMCDTCTHCILESHLQHCSSLLKMKIKLFLTYKNTPNSGELNTRSKSERERKEILGEGYGGVDV